MEKKDIYEHLAKIYLDASSKKKKKKSFRNLIKGIYIILGVFVISLSVILASPSFPKKHFSSEITLVILPEAAKINFNFDSAKKEIYTIALNGLNLDKFNSLGFSIKKKNYKDVISLRVELINSFKERSEIYLRNIAHKWQDYKINFSDFKHINDWSRVTGISFVVEEWNSSGKEGVVYIDNVRLLR